MAKNKNKKNVKPPAEPVPSPSKVPLPPPSNSTSLVDMLSTLSSRLSETESSLNFLLESPMTLAEQADSLPLLDRAKFYVTMTYAIDSLIFCFLRTRGVNFKDHPVMQELERVKTYIRKVNAAEQVPTDRNLVVDKPAAQRMIMHSIPKKQIVPDPNSKPSTNQLVAKRVVGEISSDQSSPEQAEVQASKKPKIQKSEATTVSNSTKKKGDKRKPATAEGAETPEKVLGGQVGDDVPEVAEGTAIDGNSKKKQKKNGMAGSVESATETSDASNNHNVEIEPKKKKRKKSQS